MSERVGAGIPIDPGTPAGHWHVLGTNLWCLACAEAKARVVYAGPLKNTQSPPDSSDQFPASRPE